MFESTIGRLALALTAAFIVLLNLSLIAWSSFELSLTTLWHFWFDFDATSMKQQIIATLRMPRALNGALIGANLAVAGALMQGLTRNPLASPSVLAINAGASLCIVISSIGLISLPIPTMFMAAIGSMLSGLLVIFLGGFFDQRPHPLKLVLAGIAINALLLGLTRACIILADDMAYSVQSWLIGSMSNLDWAAFSQLSPFSLAGLTLAWLLAHQINLLSLGHDVATNLGVNTNRIRLLACLAIVTLTSISVATAGPIGFIGLLVPHIAKKLAGPNFRLLIPVSACIGACLMTLADMLSRAIAFPTETPVGIVTALIGTPFFILVAIRGRFNS
ncbi:iron ABC transporter [Vibrio sp. 10N.286.49.C2]|uniref:FecCD family ABC transporter permease n=1 Tax=unclassified Vibrio TaxID=2614977 RepID=UPI000C857AF7|nr:MULTISPECIES: iron chelate uptake ABC transporter family permease subunit [unclassified Vibrio]PMH43351.1 iron ABC transporter [Vibrio sp. 10N.286.49.C2]PMH57003.1 iron ABC transporter [Vibrio sp. 10N.286.49.B1]PMH79869.1 iron ABC transporter [Vibrio sp. 10N.286.48.B7]